MQPSNGYAVVSVMVVLAVVSLVTLTFWGGYSPFFGDYSITPLVATTAKAGTASGITIATFNPVTVIAIRLLQV